MAYLYDRRIARFHDATGSGQAWTTVEKYVYDSPPGKAGLDDVVLTFDGSGNVAHRYLHGPGVDQVFADENALNEVLWGLADRQGSLERWVEYDDSTGATSVAAAVTFDAWGNITEQTPGFEVFYAYTGRVWDAATDLYDYRTRVYDAHAGRFLSEDPIGFAGGQVNLTAYVGNGPTNYTDPSGLLPNQQNLIGLADLYNAILSIEREFPGETPRDHLTRLRDVLKTGEFADGADVPDGLLDLLRGDLLEDDRGKTWAYMCTERDGYIDLPHFTEAAVWAAGGTPPFLVKRGGRAVETRQWVVGTFLRPSAPGWLSSVNTAEDVYSNDLGADFGWSLSDTAPLSAQCFDFFDPRGPLPPELAPWHDRLPKTEDEWEHIFRTDPRRARELNALVWRARPVVAPKP